MPRNKLFESFGVGQMSARISFKNRPTSKTLDEFMKQTSSNKYGYRAKWALEQLTDSVFQLHSRTPWNRHYDKGLSVKCPYHHYPMDVYAKTDDVHHLNYYQCPHCKNMEATSDEQ